MIRVNDDYYVTVDPCNYILCRDKHKTDKKGNDLYIVVGYYNNLERALQGAVADMNRRAFIEATYSLQEAIEVIQQSNKTFIDMLSEVCKIGTK
jgi:hypothetical protein